MSLEGIFFLSQSIESAVVTLFFIIFIFFFVRLMRELSMINKKIIEVAEEGVEVAEEAKEYIGKIGKSALDYFVLKIVKSVRRKK